MYPYPVWIIQVYVKVASTKDSLYKYQPSGAGGTCSTPATPQRLTARQIQNVQRGL